MRKPIPDKPVLTVVAAALVRTDGRLLLARRPEGKAMAGLWELPGGKIEAGENPERALVRELREELNLVVDQQNLSPFTFASHGYDAFHLLMPVYLCREWRGEPDPQEGQALAWAAPTDIWSYPAPAADVPLFQTFVDWSARQAS